MDSQQYHGPQMDMPSKQLPVGKGTGAESVAMTTAVGTYMCLCGPLLTELSSTALLTGNSATKSHAMIACAPFRAKGLQKSAEKYSGNYSAAGNVVCL